MPPCWAGARFWFWRSSLWRRWPRSSTGPWPHWGSESWSKSRRIPKIKTNQMDTCKCSCVDWALSVTHHARESAYITQNPLVWVGGLLYSSVPGLVGPVDNISGSVLVFVGAAAVLSAQLSSALVWYVDREELAYELQESAGCRRYVILNQRYSLIFVCIVWDA